MKFHNRDPLRYIGTKSEKKKNRRRRKKPAARKSDTFGSLFTHPRIVIEAHLITQVANFALEMARLSKNHKGLKKALKSDSIRIRIVEP